jgi:acyl carrier protein
MSEIKRDIIEIISSVCKGARISDADGGKTLKALGVDSLDTANIFLEILEKHGVNVPDEDMDRLQTIDQIVEYIEEKRN